MIELTDALAILEKAGPKPPAEAENLELSRACGRILAEEVISAIQMPPFDKAAMDGYAISSTDTATEFRVTGVVAAGDPPGAAIKTGEALRIMTGAPVPAGADQVVIREVSDETEGRVRFTRRDNVRNICLRGEDLKPGDMVLAKGTRLGPAALAAAAAAGRARLKVAPIPRVAVLVTGSEIVAPGETLRPGQIFDSNGISIAAQLRSMRVPPVSVSRVGDDAGQIRAAVKELIGESDVLILSGGVSMGDFDHVPAVLEDLAVKLHFTRVAMKPGKPSVFGSHKGGYVFGLPGNPVSTFVVFEIMIKPFLFRMMGHEFQPQIVAAPMAAAWRRCKMRRTEFLPVRIDNGMVTVPEYHGSAHVFALTGAEGLLEVPAGVGEIAREETVHVRLLGA